MPHVWEEYCGPLEEVWQSGAECMGTRAFVSMMLKVGAAIAWGGSFPLFSRLRVADIPVREPGV